MLRPVTALEEPSLASTTVSSALFEAVGHAGKVVVRNGREPIQRVISSSGMVTWHSGSPKRTLNSTT